MKYLATSVAFIAVMGCVCSGLLVGPVRIISNQTFLDYYLGNTSLNVLQCPFTLEAGDGEVSKVSWTVWKDGEMVGTFEYQPTDRNIASGLLEGKVNLDRKDGSLQFTKLEYDLSGNYSCAVTPTHGRTVEAEKWEVLVIDIPGSWHFLQKSWDPCTIVMSFQSPAVFPEITVLSGMYSASWGGFYDEVPASMFTRTVYPNKSISFSYTDYLFEVDKDTPTDVIFFTDIRVVKSDKSYISLGSERGNNSAWSERGCPPIPGKEHQMVKFKGTALICRDEHKPVKAGDTAMASVGCRKGYHGHGEVQQLEFYCNLASLNWTNPQGHNLSDLKCVPDESDHHNHHKEDGDDDDDNAGMTPLASLTLLLTALTLHRLIH